MEETTKPAIAVELSLPNETEAEKIIRVLGKYPSDGMPVIAKRLGMAKNTLYARLTKYSIITGRPSGRKAKVFV